MHRQLSTADHLRSPSIPIWLKIGATVMIGEYLALFVSMSFNAIGAIGFGIGCAVVWLLLRGSRIAWLLGLLTAATQVTAVFFTTQSHWPVVTSAIVAGSLLAPPSRRYVWSKRPRGKLDGWRAVIERAEDRFRDVEYTWLGRVLGIGQLLEDGAERRSPRLRNILWMLAIWVVVLLPLVGTLDKFHNGSARGNEAVDLLWHLVWVGWNLGLLALVALLFVSYSAGKKRGGLRQ